MPNVKSSSCTQPITENLTYPNAFHIRRICNAKNIVSYSFLNHKLEKAGTSFENPIDWKWTVHFPTERHHYSYYIVPTDNVTILYVLLPPLVSIWYPCKCMTFCFIRVEPVSLSDRGRIEIMWELGNIDLHLRMNHLPKVVIPWATTFVCDALYCRIIGVHKTVDLHWTNKHHNSIISPVLNFSLLNSRSLH